MKKIALILALLAFALMLSGCATGKVDDSMTQKSKEDNCLLMTISYEKDGEVIVDKATRVMYWKSEGGYNGGTLTLLVNPDGTPRIWEG